MMEIFTWNDVLHEQIGFVICKGSTYGVGQSRVKQIIWPKKTKDCFVCLLDNGNS
jgi:hypothetical protein